MTGATKKAERRGSGDQKPAFEGVLDALAKVLRTLVSRWKLLVPLWLAISAVLVALIFLLPREYNRSFTLAVTPTQSELQARLAQPVSDAARAKSAAATFLEQASFGPVSVDPQYDPARPQEQVSVQAESSDRQALADVGLELVAAAEEGFADAQEVAFGNAVRGRIASLRSQVATQEESLRMLDEQIDQTRPAGPEDVEMVVRLTVVETQRQATLSGISGIEAQIKVFEGDLQNLPELADDTISVEVASETPVRQGNRRAPAAAFAVLLGFVAAAGVVLWAAARNK